MYTSNTFDQGILQASVCSVPCKRRVAEVEGYDEAAEQLLETDAEGDGWVSTAEASHRDTNDAEIPDLDDDTNQTSVTQHATTAEEDVPDLDDLGIEDEDDEVVFACIACLYTFVYVLAMTYLT